MQLPHNKKIYFARSAFWRTTPGEFSREQKLWHGSTKLKVMPKLFFGRFI
jgi:hypothetical protein